MKPWHIIGLAMIVYLVAASTLTWVSYGKLPGLAIMVLNYVVAAAIMGPAFSAITHR